jgi:hypothetical protein
MTELAHLQKGKVYRLQSRNLSCGVWDGETGFIGIRCKFGSRFLETEIHWDLDENHGTAQAMNELGAFQSRSGWTSVLALYANSAVSQ